MDIIRTASNFKVSSSFSLERRWLLTEKIVGILMPSLIFHLFSLPNATLQELGQEALYGSMDIRNLSRCQWTTAMKRSKTTENFPRKYLCFRITSVLPFQRLRNFSVPHHRLTLFCRTLCLQSNYLVSSACGDSTDLE